MKNLILTALAATSALALAVPVLADNHAASDDAAAFAKTHAEALSGALNHPTREGDRARDQFRNPAETLSFFQIAPDMKVGEYAPGSGWYSRVFGHYLGGEGEFVGLFPNPLTATPDAARQQAMRDTAAGFGAKVAEWTGLPADRFSGMTLETIPDDQKGTFDRITVVRMMHNMMRSGTADTEIRAMRELLKDDGMLGIVQHRARPDAPWSYANGTKGYMREADIIDFMRINGFELAGKSEVNANPRDTADHPEGVWEMPPIQATKRDDLKDLGESDRMTLLFKKAA
ncbi:MAG: class I SAM-dependent methyltransferase [Erythrobacter sp.]